MNFEWDEKKRQRNIEIHGIDFFDAALIFENPLIEALDDRKDYGELRYIALGLSQQLVLCVVYTWRDKNLVRIISAWRASQYDRERYYSETNA
ncbi:MAG: BrnT family toxin [Alphaproteobacteria bacterium]|nr:BrnT family toxin [Alphaproteobacteria bacterium]